ncbi:predicted protein [Plenodomus lingam JN3]|uniref:Predicted protein n=1 Tax=Leptosphaeria maculans (strain JN3 / isolate v23.1.3 / race Av1-4-5-6-7-8) TaxID=985895 RepID=E4ZJS4_LEPMJ|nr:predicted protein [Plenodomus lingam JN3]CBX91359.1 predicted protein [Plenodomus lingam JN3]
MKKFWQRKLSPSEIIIVKDSRSIQVCQGVYGAKADALRLFNRMSMLWTVAQGPWESLILKSSDFFDEDLHGYDLSLG